MHQGPKEDEKTYHAKRGERSLTMDTWADIGRKTLVVAVVSLTVWAACALMRHAVELGTERLFHTAEAYGSEHILWGAGFIFAIILIGAVARGLLLLRPAWKEAEGDGIDKALISYHQTYAGDGDDPTTRYAEPTFMRAVRKIVITTLTIATGGSGGFEAPGVYLGETLGAGWSKVFKRPSADELRLYQLAGVAAAIAALLAAPFTAAIFAGKVGASDAADVNADGSNDHAIFVDKWGYWQRFLGNRLETRRRQPHAYSICTPNPEFPSWASS